MVVLLICPNATYGRDHAKPKTCLLTCSGRECEQATSMMAKKLASKCSKHRAYSKPPYQCL